MNTKATYAILFASPGSMTGAGGFWITSKGLVKIPPHLPKVREMIERAVAQCLTMREPDFLPGPTPKPHAELKTFAEKSLVTLVKTFAASSSMEVGGGTIIFQNYITGNYIYIDSEGHVHYVVVDPRFVSFVAAAETWLAAEKFDNQALTHSVQEMVAPFIQDRAAQLAPMMAHA